MTPPVPSAQEHSALHAAPAINHALAPHARRDAGRLPGRAATRAPRQNTLGCTAVTRLCTSANDSANAAASSPSSPPLGGLGSSSMQLVGRLVRPAAPSSCRARAAARQAERGRRCCAAAGGMLYGAHMLHNRGLTLAVQSRAGLSAGVGTVRQRGRQVAGRHKPTHRVVPSKLGLADAPRTSLEGT